MSSIFHLNNTNAQKHGGAKAVKQLSTGQPLTGPAAEVQEQVQTELAEAGRAAIVREGAIRLEAVARLYFNAVVDAAEKGDLAKLDTYVKRFGWLQSSALRGWAQVKQEEDTQPKTYDYEQIISKGDGQ